MGRVVGKVYKNSKPKPKKDELKQEHPKKDESAKTEE